MKVKVLIPSHVQLCNPLDCSPPGSSVYGILQARILEWVAIPFSRGSFQHRDQICVSCITGRFFTIWSMKETQYLPKVKTQWKLLSRVWLTWAVTHQAPLSMGFSRHKHWSGLPFSSPGDLPKGRFFTICATREVQYLPKGWLIKLNSVVLVPESMADWLI